MLASASNDGTVRFWDVASGNNIASLNAHSGSVRSVAFSPDGKLLASGGDRVAFRDVPETGGRVYRYHGEIKLWNVSTGKNTATFALDGKEATPLSVTFSPDGRTLASGRPGEYGPEVGTGEIKLWDIATGKNTATRKVSSGYVYQVVFSPDGQMLASGGGRPEYLGEVKLWNVATRKNTATFSGKSQIGIGTDVGRESNLVYSVAFSPDGKIVAAGGWDNDSIKLWDVVTGRNTATLRGHTNSVWSVAYSANGKTIASGSRDQTVRLWDVATGKNTSTLKGHTDGVTTVAFSPDGTVLASGGDDSTIRLWDVKPVAEADK